MLTTLYQVFLSFNEKNNVIKMEEKTLVMNKYSVFPKYHNLQGNNVKKKLFCFQMFKKLNIPIVK